MRKGQSGSGHSQCSDNHADGYADRIAAFVNYLLSQITTPEMTTYDKAKACYDWLIAYMQYGMPDYDMVDTDSLYFANFYDCIEYVALMSATGVCDDYSFIYSKMLNAIGLDSYLISGLTHKAGGGYTGHTWVVANIDGVEYVFDPQVEDNIASPLED